MPNGRMRKRKRSMNHNSNDEHIQLMILNKVLFLNS
jgi:hypothetical protein